MSAQELIDCDTEFNYGCDGGNPRYGMQYAVRKGLVRWRSYPYREEDSGDCYALTNETRFFLTSATQLRGYDPDVIIKALQDGPIAVGICGTDDEFLFYSSGIFDESSCCTQQNHAMLLVGYGHDERADCDYWILFNSWGEGWGERGLMRLLRYVIPLSLIIITELCVIAGQLDGHQVSVVSSRTHHKQLADS